MGAAKPNTHDDAKVDSADEEADAVVGSDGYERGRAGIDKKTRPGSDQKTRSAAGDRIAWIAGETVRRFLGVRGRGQQ